MDLKKAFITGITGQDGAYLAHHLLSLGYNVVGSTRSQESVNVERLKRLNIDKRIKIVALDLQDYSQIHTFVKSFAPDEIYHLAAQSSVGESFKYPLTTFKSISLSILNLLEVIHQLGSDIKLFNASSSECFGDTGFIAANEMTAMNPISPYGAAKASAHWQVSSYRKSYSIFACSAILANHESPLRSKYFVTQKIISAANAIKSGKQDFIELGALDVWRDWGWAPDYVKAMHLMLQASVPKDFIIASGVTSSLHDFAREVFCLNGLNLDQHLKVNTNILRPTEIKYSSLDPSSAKAELGWESNKSITDISYRLISAQLF